MKHELTPEVISQIVDFAKKYEPKGDLKGIPREVISKMLQRQYEQTGKWDVKVFEDERKLNSHKGGFSWYETIEKYDFWSGTIGSDHDPDFATFFTRYPERFESELKYKDSLGYPLQIGEEIYLELVPPKQEEKPTKPVYVTPCGTFTEGEEVLTDIGAKRIFYKYDEKLVHPYLCVGEFTREAYANGDKFKIFTIQHISKINLPSIEEVASKAGISVEQLKDIVKQGK